jgi:hypothetical protein
MQYDIITRSSPLNNVAGWTEIRKASTSFRSIRGGGGGSLEVQSPFTLPINLSVLCSQSTKLTAAYRDCCNRYDIPLTETCLILQWQQTGSLILGRRHCLMDFIYYYYYLLQLGFHPVAVVLTLVHTIQMFSPCGSSPYTSTHNTNIFTRWQ